MQRMEEAFPLSSKCHLSAKTCADLSSQIPSHNLTLWENRMQYTTIVATLQDAYQRTGTSFIFFKLENIEEGKEKITKRTTTS